MFNGWFGAAAPAEDAAAQQQQRDVVGQSDSDGEFVVVEEGAGYSTSTRGGGGQSEIGGRVLTDALEEDDVTEATQTAPEKEGADVKQDEVPEVIASPVEEEPVAEEAKEVVDVTAPVVETAPCPAGRPGATFAYDSSAVLLSIDQEAAHPEEGVSRTDTEVDTVVDDAAAVDSCQASEAGEEDVAAPVEEEDTNAKWVDAAAAAASSSPVADNGSFGDCYSAPQSNAIITEDRSAAPAAAASSSSSNTVIYPWGSPCVEIVIADVDVAEQELLSEIFNSGNHHRLAKDAVQAAQRDEVLTPQDRRCLSVLIPPATTDEDATTFVCWNMARVLTLVEEKLESKKITATTPDDIRELMILHSLLSRVSPTPNPSHHIAIAALLIRQSKLESGGVMEAAPILRQLRKAVDEGFNELELLCGDERFVSLHGFTEFDGFIADALEDWEPVLQVQSLLGKRGSNSIKICDIMAHIFYADGDTTRAAKSLQDLYF